MLGRAAAGGRRHRAARCGCRARCGRRPRRSPRLPGALRTAHRSTAPLARLTARRRVGRSVPVPAAGVRDRLRTFRHVGAAAPVRDGGPRTSSSGAHPTGRPARHRRSEPHVLIHHARPTVSGAPPGDAGRAAERVHALEIEVAQLRTAMASRAVIEQAKGVLMLLTGCTDQVAFDLLTHISSHTHRKVREVAHGARRVGDRGAAALPADVRTILRDACPPAHPPDRPPADLRRPAGGRSARIPGRRPARRRRERGGAGVFYLIARFVLRPLMFLLLPAAHHRPGERAARRAGRSWPATTCPSSTASSSRWRPRGGSAYLAKAEYFTTKGFSGWFTRTLFTALGAYPVERETQRAAQAALDTALRLLKDGLAFGVYPEGTRSKDGRLARGKTGVAWLALTADCPVVPVGRRRHRQGPAGRRQLAAAAPDLDHLRRAADLPRAAGPGRHGTRPAAIVTDRIMEADRRAVRSGEGGLGHPARGRVSRRTARRRHDLRRRQVARHRRASAAGWCARGSRSRRSRRRT